MSKEVMRQALEGAANYIDALGGDSRKYRQALANEALDKMAENARELGLDYEPAQQEPVTATCLTTGNIRLYASVEKTKIDGFEPKHVSAICLGKRKMHKGYTFEFTPSPTAQRTWVGLTQEEFRDFATTYEYGTGGLIRAIEAKLKEKNT